MMLMVPLNPVLYELLDISRNVCRGFFGDYFLIAKFQEEWKNYHWANA